MNETAAGLLEGRMPPRTVSYIVLVHNDYGTMVYMTMPVRSEQDAMEEVASTFGMALYEVGDRTVLLPEGVDAADIIEDDLPADAYELHLGPAEPGQIVI